MKLSQIIIDAQSEIINTNPNVNYPLEQVIINFNDVRYLFLHLERVKITPRIATHVGKITKQLFYWRISQQ